MFCQLADSFFLNIVSQNYQPAGSTFLCVSKQDTIHAYGQYSLTINSLIWYTVCEASSQAVRTSNRHFGNM